MVFIANELKKPVVLLVMDVPSKIVQLKFLIVILQVTSKLIQFYLENVKVKQWLRLSSVRVGLPSLNGLMDEIVLQ